MNFEYKSRLKNHDFLLIVINQIQLICLKSELECDNTGLNIFVSSWIGLNCLTQFQSFEKQWENMSQNLENNV